MPAASYTFIPCHEGVDTLAVVDLPVKIIGPADRGQGLIGCSQSSIVYWRSSKF